ncbi:MAG: hypothetical protein ING59_02680 [Burkholderiales bacterium]|nr:hypothetical protein [Burkholderiales bacterium]
MTTPITLTVGAITLTFNKWEIGVDHGMLFQESDRQRRHHPDIDYSYYDEHPEEDPAQSETCFCRSLGSMLPRLELLGYTLATVKAEYEVQVMQEAERYADDDDGAPAPTRPERLEFNRFIEFICRYPVSDLNDEYRPDTEAGSEQWRARLAADPAVALLPQVDQDRDVDGYSERSHFGGLIGFLSPYSVLRVLAENPANLKLDVVWDYGNFVAAGWAKNEEFVAGARRAQTFLLATEGTSDTHILKRGLSLLRPDVEDFFRFIDIEERHPFSGTSNLAKFAEGLVKIDVQNRVVFVFDNDAEGVDAYRSLQRFSFPANMRSMLLPDLDQLRDFPARGPSGVVRTDINGRAAAIECYLDLRLAGRPEAQVTWTNFKESLGTYQGALDFKESYAKAFYEVSVEAIATGTYDVSKLRTVLDALFATCCAMSTDILLRESR